MQLLWNKKTSKDLDMQKVPLYPTAPQKSPCPEGGNGGSPDCDKKISKNN